VLLDVVERFAIFLIESDSRHGRTYHYIKSSLYLNVLGMFLWDAETYVMSI